ncbi:MFS transporter [Georgenia sp. SYP-B2076]|uniref:MFS transporter n=1 Tax=Georgenia sp. SYP-B2076 TaxID=2495881 RepID=UPI00197AD4D9|nr:MFS transporter [Georgenia sp. SYP-B2076]
MTDDLASRPTPAPTTEAPTRGIAIPWRQAGLYMAVTFSLLQMLNEVGAMMAIPMYGAMSAELGLTPNQVSWVLLATTLAGAASIALLSKAGDLFGHRRLMVWCVLGIVVGYVVSALAPNFAVLIVGRALTGVMAGQALCVGIMNDRLTELDRRKAIGIIGGGQAIGVFFGFALGGLMIVLGASWRTAFWIGAILTVISLVAFLAWGSDSDAVKRNVGASRRMDVLGVLLMGLGLTALCIGISQSTVWGVTSGPTLVWVLGGAALLAVSLWWESRAKEPLLDIKQLFTRRLLPAYGVFIAMGIPGMLFFNLVMGYAQTPAAVAGYGFGLNPLVAGFVFIPMTVAGIVAARVVPRLLHTVAPRTVIIAAGLAEALTFVWLWAMHEQLWAVLVGVLVYGIAYTALFTTAISVIAAEAVVGKGAGTASIYVAIALSASSIGTAIYSAIVGKYTDPATNIPGAETYDVGFLVAAGASLVAVLAGLWLSKNLKLTEVVAH